jgi:hypothetical protein
MGWQRASHRRWELGGGPTAQAGGRRFRELCVTIPPTTRPLDARAYFLVRERSRAGSRNRRSAGDKSHDSLNARVSRRSIPLWEVAFGRRSSIFFMRGTASVRLAM